MCFTQNFWSLFIGGLANGCLYALIAIGYTLVYGVLRLINFAHSEVFMAGGFAGYFILRPWWEPPADRAQRGRFCPARHRGRRSAGGAVAFLLERVAYRPLRRRHAPRLAFLISAIGASYFLFNLAGKEFGRDAVEVPVTFTGTPVHDLRRPGAELLRPHRRVRHRYVRLPGPGRGTDQARPGDPGRGRGRRDGEPHGRQHRPRHLAGLRARWPARGAAGFLFGISAGVVYTMGFTPALKAFTAAVLGGIGNIRGAVLGGLTLGVAENLPSACVGASWRDVVAFGILVLVLLVRPTGILGERLGRSA